MLAIRIRKESYLENSFKRGNHYYFTLQRNLTHLANLQLTLVEEQWNGTEKEMWLALYPSPQPRPTHSSQWEEWPAAGVWESCTKKAPGPSEVRDHTEAHEPRDGIFRYGPEMDMEQPSFFLYIQRTVLLLERWCSM